MGRQVACLAAITRASSAVDEHLASLLPSSHDVLCIITFPRRLFLSTLLVATSCFSLRNWVNMLSPASRLADVLTDGKKNYFSPKPTHNTYPGAMETERARKTLVAFCSSVSHKFSSRFQSILLSWQGPNGTAYTFVCNTTLHKHGYSMSGQCFAVRNWRKKHERPEQAK